MPIFEVLFIFIPLLAVACIPLAIAVIAFDNLLYSRWVPVMRARMAAMKWPAYIIAFAPLAIAPFLEFIESQLPPAFTPLLASPWPFTIGATIGIAFAACWLKLSPDEEDEENNVPPARSLTQEWLLAITLLAVNCIGLRLILGGW